MYSENMPTPQLQAIKAQHQVFAAEGEEEAALTVSNIQAILDSRRANGEPTFGTCPHCGADTMDGDCTNLDH